MQFVDTVGNEESSFKRARQRQSRPLNIAITTEKSSSLNNDQQFEDSDDQQDRYLNTEGCDDDMSRDSMHECTTITDDRSQSITGVMIEKERQSKSEWGQRLTWTNNRKSNAIDDSGLIKDLFY